MLGARPASRSPLLRDWYSAPSHEQDRIWNGQIQKQLLGALLLESLGWGYGAAGDLDRTWAWIDHLSFLAAMENFPGSWVAGVLASRDQDGRPVDSRTEREIGHWLAVEPSAPMPIDMEADLLAQGIEDRDVERLLPLLVSMGADPQARQVVLDRTALRMAEDSYGAGVRSILFQQWRQTAVALPSPLFAAVTILCLRLHWDLPQGCSVVVPEGRAERPLNGGKALLQSVRERDLVSYMEHVRAMGDQPVAALRQLFITVALMILEYPAGPGLEDLGRLYLWLGSVLSLTHQSLRRARRILFSAAASIFFHSGWTCQPEWPTYTSLATFRHALQQGESLEIQKDWQKTLWAHSGNEDPSSWWRAKAEQHYKGMHPVAVRPHVSFWALWQQARMAGPLTGGPLAWIHPLVLQRLSPV